MDTKKKNVKVKEIRKEIHQMCPKGKYIINPSILKFCLKNKIKFKKILFF
uniref:Uncharacterized protein n=1 Tax=Meloidogyne enterolobii TaxID=390850 RepID=A0A6V7U414_MELEN|nr:unnamed protein product [Meloidogyne enterolobii]